MFIYEMVKRNSGFTVLQDHGEWISSGKHAHEKDTIEPQFI